MGTEFLPGRLDGFAAFAEIPAVHRDDRKHRIDEDERRASDGEGYADLHRYAVYDLHDDWKGEAHPQDADKAPYACHEQARVADVERLIVVTPRHDAERRLPEPSGEILEGGPDDCRDEEKQADVAVAEQVQKDRDEDAAQTVDGRKRAEDEPRT